MPAKTDNLLNTLLEQDKKRLQRIFKLISKGVKIIDPFTTHIAENVKIAKGTIIHPLTVIEPDVRIGKNCQVGPFARIRSNTRLEDGSQVGNFVEVVRSSIGKHSKAKHLTYIGDTKIEQDVNVGAGTIIANYDGKNKNRTRICKGAFIGSGSILIAPLKVGKSAITGAGAVVTKNRNVPDKAVVIGIPAKIMKQRRKEAEKPNKPK